MAQETTPDDAAQTAAATAHAFDADTDGTVFRGTLNASTLEHYPRTFYGLTDEIRVKVTPNGLYTCAVDPKNVILGRVFLPPAHFDEFTVASPGQVGIQVEDFYDIARFGSGDVRLEIDHVRDFGNDDEASFFVNDGQTVAGVPAVIDADMVRRPPDIPDIPYEFEAVLENANAFREFAKSHTGSDTSEYVRVTASLSVAEDDAATVTFANDETDVDPLVLAGDDLAEFNYTGTDGAERFGDAELESEVAEYHAGNVVVTRALYSADYLKNAMKRVRKSDVDGEPLRIKFGSEWPMWFRQSLEMGGFRDWLLAPRIESDE